MGTAKRRPVEAALLTDLIPRKWKHLREGNDPNINITTDWNFIIPVLVSWKRSDWFGSPKRPHPTFTVTPFIDYFFNRWKATMATLFRSADQGTLLPITWKIDCLLSLHPSHPSRGTIPGNIWKHSEVRTYNWSNRQHCRSTRQQRCCGLQGVFKFSWWF